MAKPWEFGPFTDDLIVLHNGNRDTRVFDNDGNTLEAVEVNEMVAEIKRLQDWQEKHVDCLKRALGGDFGPALEFGALFLETIGDNHIVFRTVFRHVGGNVLCVITDDSDTQSYGLSKSGTGSNAFEALKAAIND